jgi:hypothetical protein
MIFWVAIFVLLLVLLVRFLPYIICDYALKPVNPARYWNTKLPATFYGQIYR